MSPSGAARLALCALALGVLTVPSAAPAQQPARVARIEILCPAVNPRSAPFLVAFDQRLRDLGWIEGQNLAIDFRTPPGFDAARLPEAAAEVVRST